MFRVRGLFRGLFSLKFAALILIIISTLFLMDSLIRKRHLRNQFPAPYQERTLLKFSNRAQITAMNGFNGGEHRLIHLDLKGGPLKLSYYSELFPVLKSWGATGLLIEWEDTFPYWGPELSMIGSTGPDSSGLYTSDEVDEILSLASQHGLEVIPLVQTFGHLEFVLKHDSFRHLREVENFPSSICPTKSETLPLVKNMLTQVIDRHPGLKFLHIGADEVWHLGLCESCKSKMASIPHNSTSSSITARGRLFLDHVVSVLQWLKVSYPSLQVLMWDDMLRHMDPLIMQDYDLKNLVEPMVWHYRPSKTFHLPHDLWSKYSSTFNGFWVATAFKGASGSNAQVPLISQHLDCQERWIQELQSLRNTENKLRLRGVAITGWSRYDHYAVMCELLPTGLPSLALCLAQWQTGTFSPEVHRTVSLNLGCPPGELYPLHPHPRELTNAPLSFPGWQINSYIEWLVNIQIKIHSILESEQVHTWLNKHLVSQSFTNPARIVKLQQKIKRVRSWLSPWLVKRGFTNPMQLTSLLQSVPILLGDVSKMERMLRPLMEDVYPSSVVAEWFGTTVEPSRDRLQVLLRELEHQVAIGGRIRNYKPSL